MAKEQSEGITLRYHLRDGKLLMKGIKSSEILAKLAQQGSIWSRPRNYISEVRDEELAQISRVTRYQS